MKLHALALICAVLVAGCHGRGNSVLIGAAGPWAEWSGQMTKRGIDLATTEINASGGIRGRRLEVEERDDKRDGARAAAVAQQFVADKAIVGVVGHVTSAAMVAAAKVYDGGHLVAIATSATSPDLTGISPWTFRVISSDSTNGGVIARFAAAHGWKRAAVIYENDSYGRGLADSFRRNFAGRVVSMDPIAASVPDAEPYIAYYKRIRPDVIFAVGLQISGLALLREARKEHLGIDFVGGDGWTSIIADTALAEGVYVGTAFTTEDPRPEVQRFITTFRARYHMDPDLNAALGYDATHVLARAIAAAGPDRTAVRRYIASMTERTAYDGVSGTIWFQSTGDPAAAAFRVTRIHDGSFLIVDQ